MANENLKKDANFITVIGAVDNTSDREIVQVRVDSVTKRLLVDSQTVNVGCDSIGDGTATVAVTGTAVQLPNVACKRAFIVAHEGNTGTLVIGGSTVVAALAGRRGRPLFATQGDWFNVSNLNLLYIDSTASGDKITYYYEL